MSPAAAAIERYKWTRIIPILGHPTATVDIIDVMDIIDQLSASTLKDNCSHTYAIFVIYQTLYLASYKIFILPSSRFPRSARD